MSKDICRVHKNTPVYIEDMVRFKETILWTRTVLHSVGLSTISITLYTPYTGTSPRPVLGMNGRGFEPDASPGNMEAPQFDPAG
ncbi:hypothetical protein BDBG_17350 [Blastomyces gilchristii SLH14081]|uniref:Uncharacterized protein n=1 Tax=Blastomyces gilchristii (strain SLH14081) TaxID=559298 RepID=A0A179UTI2_BLAGS|nr:uncharacterized protein BDBG_17350 [Blastomyces gilchristii SLH14081]OAT10367.1 hypothetical protein BDBG_17350 [Blastomyces gilchristii SLH14081]